MKDLWRTSVPYELTAITLQFQSQLCFHTVLNDKALWAPFKELCFYFYLLQGVMDCAYSVIMLIYIASDVNLPGKWPLEQQTF